MEDLIRFMFEVLAGAVSDSDELMTLLIYYSGQNELLLDRLVLLCSSVILANTNISNACYILSDATHYHAQQLIERLQAYITVNLESFLESRILDEIPYTLVKQLSTYVRAKHTEKSPFSRSNAFVNDMMQKHAEWLAEQDLPEPIVRRSAMMLLPAKSSAGSSKGGGFVEKISPPILGRMKPSVSMTFPSTQPVMAPQSTLRRPPVGDDVFVMDEMDTAHSFIPDSGSLPSSSPSAMATPASVPSPVWKASVSTRSVHLYLITPWA